MCVEFSPVIRLNLTLLVLTLGRVENSKRAVEKLMFINKRSKGGTNIRIYKRSIIQYT